MSKFPGRYGYNRNIYGPVKVSTGSKRLDHAGRRPPYGANSKVNDNTRYEAPVAA